MIGWCKPLVVTLTPRSQGESPMPPSMSPLETIRRSLMSGGRLPAMVAAPLALGVSLAANAAPIETLSTVKTTESFYPTAGNILITSTGGVDDTGPSVQYPLATGVWVQSSAGWTLTNQGTIKISEPTNYSQADGIYAHSYGTIINSGLISVPNTFKIGRALCRERVCA